MKKILSYVFIVFLLQACSSGYVKNPIDKFIVKMNDVQPYSIILYDMDVKGSFYNSYFHKYKIITEDVDGTPVENISDWQEVSNSFFRQNENNLGMEILSKNAEGKISKSAAPPGYGNYVGNSQYGEWRTDGGGNSFWAFYGKYMMMSTMFDLMRRPYYRSDYSRYESGGYRGRRAYYGQKTNRGSYRFGTNSNYSKQTRPGFFQRKASRRGWSQSSGRTGSRGRYSSSRSRSGGFGK